MSDDEARELYAKMIHAIKCARHSTCFFPNQGAATGTPHKIILETIGEFNDYGDKGSSADQGEGGCNDPLGHSAGEGEGKDGGRGSSVAGGGSNPGDSGGAYAGRGSSGTGSDGQCPQQKVINAWAEEAYRDIFYHMGVTPSRPSTKSMIRYFGWKLMRDLQEVDDAEVS